MVKGVVLFLVVMAAIGLLSNAVAPGSVGRAIQRRAKAVTDRLPWRGGRG